MGMPRDRAIRPSLTPRILSMPTGRSEFRVFLQKVSSSEKTAPVLAGKLSGEWIAMISYRSLRTRATIATSRSKREVPISSSLASLASSEIESPSLSSLMMRTVSMLSQWSFSARSRSASVRQSATTASTPRAPTARPASPPNDEMFQVSGAFQSVHGATA